MKKLTKQITLLSVILLSSSIALSAVDLTKAYEMPDASKLIEKDLLAEPTVYTMPKSCKLDDLDAITRGAYIFHNLNGKKAKAPAPKGLVKFIEKKDKDGKVKKVAKQYGNVLLVIILKVLKVVEILGQI